MMARDEAGSSMKELAGRNVQDLAKFARFLAVGLVNTIAGFFLFLLFFSVLGLHYLLANLLVFLSWVWFGFELQRKWAFRAKASSAAFGKHFLNQIVFTALGSALLWGLVEGFNARPELAYVLTLGTVTVGLYMSSLFWVFGRADGVSQ